MFISALPSTSTSPALTSQLHAQIAFFSDVSQKMVEGMQKITELNLQVAKTLLEESATRSRQLLSAQSPNEGFSIVAQQSMPMLEKVRAYQQHVQKICADTQADVTKSVQSYMPESARATEAVVREVAQKASEVTTTATQRQQEAIQNITAATKQNADRVVEASAAKR